MRDGKFAFVVTSIDRSKRGGDPSNGFMQETAQGEYLNVHMTVSNVGDRSQTFFATNQKLMTGGRQFEADTMVSVWDGSTNVDINPGNSINATASFDIPAGTPPGTIELHDSGACGTVITWRSFPPGTPYEHPRLDHLAGGVLLSGAIAYGDRLGTCRDNRNGLTIQRPESTRHFGPIYAWGCAG